MATKEPTKFSANDVAMYRSLQETLESSPTAYAPGVTPTRTDIKNQLSLMSLESKKTLFDSEQASLNWYGKKDAGGNKPETEKSGKSQGLFAKGMNLLSTPLYGIVGAAETLTGTGQTPGLFDNIAENIKERGTAGDVLRRSGVPQALAMPAGLAMDIALDPVNWYTAGTAALIPKLAYGLGKAGPQGLAAAAKAGTLEKASGFLRYMPKVLRVGEEKVAEKAIKATNWYDEIVGRDFITDLDAKAAKTNLVDKGLNKMDKVLPGFRDWWVYDPAGNIIKKASEEAADISSGKINTTKFDTELRFGGKRGLTEIDIDELKRRAEDAINIAKAEKGSLVAKNSEDMLLRLGQEAADTKNQKELIDKITPPKKISDYDETGAKLYDDMMKKLRKNETVAKMLDGYAKYIGLFKNVKTSGNPGSYTLSVVGNTGMAQMMGFKTDAPFFSSLKNAYSVVTGKTPAPEYLDFINSPDFREWLQKHPTLIPSVYGLTKQKMRKVDMLASMLEAGARRGESIGMSKMAIDDWNRETVSLYQRYEREVAALTPIQLQRGGYASGINPDTGRIIREGIPMSTSGIIQDIYSSPYKDYLDNLEKSGNPLANVLHKYLTKSAEWYERIDQSFKLGITFKMAHHGLTEAELKAVSNFVKIGKDDIVGGKKINGLYKIKLDKSMEVAAETYMNYMAMPTFVKLARQVPLVGAPFASFMYAMTTKTAKTALRNPAVFNKINFGMQEISGDKSPLEKEALKGQYFSRYADPGMVKLNFLPFSENYPVYSNFANMLSYYSLNIYQPSERRFDSALPDNIVSFIDKFPALKTPEGQVMFDYFILPLLLKSSGEAPKGMFDQPLYPADASNLQKYAAYPLRQAAEAVVPPIAGLAGLVIPGTYAELLPLYQARKISQAKEGKTPAGVLSKEPAFQRTVRGIIGLAGVSAYPVDLSFQASEEKKKIK